MDSSKTRLKAVLLHNSFPVAHSPHMNEIFENLDIILHTVNLSSSQLWRFESCLRDPWSIKRIYKVIIFYR